MGLNDGNEHCRVFLARSQKLNVVHVYAPLSASEGDIRDAIEPEFPQSIAQIQGLKPLTDVDDQVIVSALREKLRAIAPHSTLHVGRARQSIKCYYTELFEASDVVVEALIALDGKRLVAHSQRSKLQVVPTMLALFAIDNTLLKSVSARLNHLLEKNRLEHAVGFTTIPYSPDLLHIERGHTNLVIRGRRGNTFPAVKKKIEDLFAGTDTSGWVQQDHDMKVKHALFLMQFMPGVNPDRPMHNHRKRSTK